MQFSFLEIDVGILLRKCRGISIGLTAIVSTLTAIVVAILTSVLTRRRELEGDWRKLKFAQYQEFILGLSGIVDGRSTPDAQRRYSDAVNSMSLVASSSVLRAMRAFQKEISFANQERSNEAHDRLLNDLFRALRNDIYPRKHERDADFNFGLLGVPPDPLDHSKDYGVSSVKQDDD
mgnify:CR=1 FL=1